MANDRSDKFNDIDLLVRLEAIEERFESVWNKEGQRPNIKEFVEQNPDMPSGCLTRELIQLEIKLRMNAGETPTAEEYSSRFRNLDQIWLAELIEAKSGETQAVEQNPPLDYSVPDVSTPRDYDDAEQVTRGPEKRSGRSQPFATFASFGDYEIIEEIARGGMGVVYKAKQKTLNRIVALKTILSGQFAGHEEIRRFRSEAEAAANLDHPGIVPIHDIGEHDGHQYFSMGFIKGTSLQAKLIDGPMSTMEAAETTRKIADAIAFAHKKGVIHRDLKPANVLIDPNGEPRVTDFGLAKQIGGDSDLTGTGQILGTPSFMPPEQALGQASKVDERADVWALGAILYCLLAGRPPFQAATALDTLKQVIEKEPVRLRSLDPKIPVDLETITLKCLEKEPVKRYQTAQDLKDELVRFTRGEPISPSSDWRRLKGMALV